MKTKIIRKNKKIKKESQLKITAQLIDNGVQITVKNKKFKIEYPKDVWDKTPPSVKQALLENLTFGNTHFLPLFFDFNKIIFNFKQPIFDSFFFRNQLNDLFYCEKADKAKRLSYFKQFYNLDYEFERGEGSIPLQEEVKSFKSSPAVAIIPFSFGKESLVTMALCLELGIKPILVYCQEPAHPHEERFKLKQLEKIKKDFKVDVYFIKNDPGLFRYDKAFNHKPGTEIGWACQTTLHVLMMVPFVYRHKAKYILLGNEQSNNEFEMVDGWKEMSSCDQTSCWTGQQNIMSRFLTNNQCLVKSSLEPIQEINIFSMLHHRYPKIGQYQFSCGAEKPLLVPSQWCHKCYKCSRMYLFAIACGVDPVSIGFKKNLLDSPGMFDHYFGEEVKTGSASELDFAFFILHKKGINSMYSKKFVDKKLNFLKPWDWYLEQFAKLHPENNLPEEYRNKMLEIFNEELNYFKKNLLK